MLSLLVTQSFNQYYNLIFSAPYEQGTFYQTEYLTSSECYEVRTGVLRKDMSQSHIQK